MISHLCFQFLAELAITCISSKFKENKVVNRGTTLHLLSFNVSSYQSLLNLDATTFLHYFWRRQRIDAFS